MKLAHYQIQHIENYVRSQRIHYRDIRHELTDHIASAIEHKIEERHLTFSEAFSEAIEEINCFAIQRKKLIGETVASCKHIISDAFNLLRGYRLIILTLASTLITCLYMNIADTSRLDDWLSTILKVLIVLPVIFSVIFRRQKLYRFSYFMASVVGLYLFVEVITATKTFVIDNIFMAQPLGQSIYFSLCFFVALIGYQFIFRTYQRVKQHAIH